MNARRKLRPGWIVGSAVVGLLVLAALNFETLAFGAAMLLAEKRPALLSDAHWQDPSSARRFERRFGEGSAEQDLLNWLAVNRFVVDPAGRQAHRSVESLPCNEGIEISWTSDGSGQLRTAEATVSEAGCL
jgi:hypothetical protein